jgi:hypothetical protein
MKIFVAIHTDFSVRESKRCVKRAPFKNKLVSASHLERRGLEWVFKRFNNVFRKSLADPETYRAIALLREMLQFHNELDRDSTVETRKKRIKRMKEEVKSFEEIVSSHFLEQGISEKNAGQRPPEQQIVDVFDLQIDMTEELTKDASTRRFRRKHDLFS